MISFSPTTYTRCEENEEEIFKETYITNGKKTTGYVINDIAEMLRFRKRDIQLIGRALGTPESLWREHCSHDYLLDMIHKLCDPMLISTPTINLIDHLSRSLFTKKAEAVDAVTHHRCCYLLGLVDSTRKLQECSDPQHIWTKIENNLRKVTQKKVHVPCPPPLDSSNQDDIPLVCLWRAYIKDPSAIRFEALQRMGPLNKLLMMSPLSEHKLLKKNSKAKKTLIRSGSLIHSSLSVSARTNFLRFWASLLMSNPHPNEQLSKIQTDVQDLACKHVAKCVESVANEQASKESINELKTVVEATSLALEASLQAVKVQSYRAIATDKRKGEKVDVCRSVALSISHILMKSVIDSPTPMFSTPIILHNMENIVSTVCFLALEISTNLNFNLETDDEYKLVMECNECILRASKECPSELVSHVSRLLHVYDSMQSPPSNKLWYKTLANLYPRHCTFEIWDNLSIFTDALLHSPSTNLLKLINKLSLNMETVKHSKRYLLTSSEVLDKLEKIVHPTDDKMSLLALGILLALVKNKCSSLDFAGRGGHYLAWVSASSFRHYNLAVNLVITLALSKGGHPDRHIQTLVNHLDDIGDVSMQECIFQGLIQLARIKPTLVLKYIPSLRRFSVVPCLDVHVKTLLIIKKDSAKRNVICRLM